MNRQCLKEMLIRFLERAVPSAERIASISDMDELIELWRKSFKARRIIEARMADVIKALSVDNIDGLPEWFATIVGDELLLPSKSLRDLFRKKVEIICLRLLEDQNQDTSQI
jgi:hypothetical protein